MRKSTIFISSVLTTFALVMLYGVVKAYQNNAAIQAAEAAVQPSATVNAPSIDRIISRVDEQEPIIR